MGAADARREAPLATARETSSRSPALASCPAKSAALHASRYVSRDRTASSGSNFLAAASRSAGASLPRSWAKASSACSRSTRARPSSSSGPASAAASSPSAASNAPACRLACAAASSRSARRAGSTVRSAARPEERRRGAEAAARLRSAGGPLQLVSDLLVGALGGVRAVPCTAIRLERGIRDVGQRCMDAPALVVRCRSIDGRSHERMPESNLCAHVQQAFLRSPAQPQCPGCPVGWPLATSGPGRRPAPRPRPGASAASAAACPPAASESSPRSGPTGAPRSGIPNPPANCAVESPRGSSSSASGLPRVSATIRSRTRSSSRPGMTVASRARASSSSRPSRTSSGRPASSAAAPGSRAANTSATGSASSRRATNPRTWREAPSSHWASSTMQRNGVFSATSARSVSTPRATRNRSGTSPDSRPSATRSARAWGGGRPSSSVEHRGAELVESRERQLHLRLDAGDLHDSEPGGPLREVSQQRGLSDPGFAANHRNPALALAHAID